MDELSENAYEHIRAGGRGFYQQRRGLISVGGEEAVQFLDGLITNDVKMLEPGQQMRAAFCNAQGRLLCVVRVRASGSGFFIETEEATREALFQNLFRFTFAGDFQVADVSENFQYFELFNVEPSTLSTGMTFHLATTSGRFEEAWQADEYTVQLQTEGAVAIDPSTFEILRIENGVPLYGIDMDETTVVPELGIDGLISYNKGCYIGQEIIARIHFRGHVAKQLTGLVSDAPLRSGSDLTVDDKDAGRITSATHSPRLGKHIALAFVRYAHLAAGTVLRAEGQDAVVTPLPFI